MIKGTKTKKWVWYLRVAWRDECTNLTRSVKLAIVLTKPITIESSTEMCTDVSTWFSFFWRCWCAACSGIGMKQPPWLGWFCCP